MHWVNTQIWIIHVTNDSKYFKNVYRIRDFYFHSNHTNCFFFLVDRIYVEEPLFTELHRNIKWFYLHFGLYFACNKNINTVFVCFNLKYNFEKFAIHEWISNESFWNEFSTRWFFYPLLLLSFSICSYEKFTLKYVRNVVEIKSILLWAQCAQCLLCHNLILWSTFMNVKYTQRWNQIHKDVIKTSLLCVCTSAKINERPR